MVDVLIIGGGLSGLSAAVELSALGCTVIVLEQHQYCGGRAYSFHDAASECTVDNGQHLMMGCYHGTRRFLRMIGADHLADLQSTLQIEYLFPSRQNDRLACAGWTAPFNLLSGILRFTALPMKDRVLILRVAKELMTTSSQEEMELDRMTVEEWLNALGQTGLTRKFLWDVITIGALNNQPQNVSALMLFRVLRAAFLGKNENACLLIPRVGLSELFVEPAVRFINAHGGAVQTGVCVEKLQLQGSRIHSVRTSDGRKLHVHSVVSAVPWYSYEEIMKASSDRADRVISPRQKNTAQNQFHSSPIISIHLWLDRKITDIDFAAVLETRIQWIFNKSTLLKSNRAGRTVGQYLSLVISGAQEFIGLNKKQLVELAIEDLRRVLPEAQNARVVHALVIKEKRATFLPSPGLDSLRPTARTQYDNLFLAGDWTATGLPATIESAVMSGRTVAKLIEQEPHH